jgi:hypothetical protein
MKFMNDPTARIKEWIWNVHKPTGWHKFGAKETSMTVAKHNTLGIQSEYECQSQGNEKLAVQAAPSINEIR